jgi:hypothetical protein
LESFLIVSIDISFIEEIWNGKESIKSFYCELAKELTNPSHKLWLYNSDNQSLFPTFNWNLHYIKCFGILIEQSLSLGFVLWIYINPPFFSRLLNFTISLSDIDKFLQNSLHNPECLMGLPFTYPGFDEIELIENG